MDIGIDDLYQSTSDTKLITGTGLYNGRFALFYAYGNYCVRRKSSYICFGKSRIVKSETYEYWKDNRDRDAVSSLGKKSESSDKIQKPQENVVLMQNVLMAFEFLSWFLGQRLNNVVFGNDMIVAAFIFCQHCAVFFID